MEESYLTPQQWNELLKNRILVLSKQNCIYCQKVKELFSSLKIEFFEYNCQYLLQTKESKALFLEQVHSVAKRPYNTFPMVFIDREFIGGYTDVGIYLEKQNAFEETDF